MKSKKVTQYSCDYCGKKKYTSYSMRVHEKHCTMNQNRECRMCDLIGSDNDIKSLVAMIPKDIIGKTDSGLSEFSFDGEKVVNREEIEDAFEKMKEEASNCPACILTVIRLLKSKVIFDFDYTKEVNNFFSDLEPEYH